MGFITGVDKYIYSAHCSSSGALEYYCFKQVNHKLDNCTLYNMSQLSSGRLVLLSFEFEFTYLECPHALRTYLLALGPIILS